MERVLSLEFLRVVETAAIASARTMGQGDRHSSDQAAVEAMRDEMDRVGMDGDRFVGRLSDAVRGKLRLVVHSRERIDANRGMDGRQRERDVAHVGRGCQARPRRT